MAPHTTRAAAGWTALLLNGLIFPGVGGFLLRPLRVGVAQFGLAAAATWIALTGGLATVLALAALFIVWVWSLGTALAAIPRSG